jgi:hypothetical protein
VIDALSLRVHEMHATTISMYKSNLKDNFRGCKITSMAHRNKGKVTTNNFAREN